MKHVFLALVLFMLAAWPAPAQQTRVITDHAGFEIAIPARPKRIITLNDWTVTVMVHELGGDLVGSSGRIDRDGSYFMRSARELYGLSFGEIELASIHGMVDVERIAALKPDLIIATLGDTLAWRDQLSLIAPTIFFDPMNGISPIRKYRQMAEWLGREDRFEDLQSQYRDRLEAVRPLFNTTSGPPSYVVIVPEPRGGTVRIFRDYGSLTTVLDDLRFRRGPVTDLVPETEEGGNFSAEMIGMLDTDFIFTTHTDPTAVNGTETMLRQLDRVAPGYRDTLPAVRGKRFASLSRFHAFPPTFAAMSYVLDQLSAERAGANAVDAIHRTK